MEKLHLLFWRTRFFHFPSLNYLPSREQFYQIGVGGRQHCRIRAHRTLELVALLKQIRLFSNSRIGTSTEKTCAVVQLVVLQSQLYGRKSVSALVSTLSTSKRRERRKRPRRERVWSCAEWMPHSVYSREKMSASPGRGVKMKKAS